MSDAAIPIQNIYYLLSYAWNKLRESEIVQAGRLDCTNIHDLLAKVLANGIVYVFHRGLDRGYVDIDEDINRVRGKIDFAATLKHHGFQRASLRCHFDDFRYDVLHNQIIKTTIHRLVRCRDLDRSIRSNLMTIFRRFEGIQCIALTKRHFGMVQLNSNNIFYDFLLKICELIHDSMLVSEMEGAVKFRDFVRDERLMATVFEEFIRNFYKREQREFKVGRENIPWCARALDEGAERFLPRMQSDVSLESGNRKIIIDAKYYRETLQSYYDIEKIHSANLYQLLAYVTNLRAVAHQDQTCEGILLYPTVSREFHHRYDLQGYPISIHTINLNQDWRGVHQDLLGFLN